MTANAQLVGEVADDWLAGVAEQPDEVRAFCNARQILAEARFAADLAIQTFPVGSSVSLRVSRDPESDAEFLVASVSTPAETDPLPGYLRFVDIWVEQVSPSAGDSIHLSFV